MPYRINDQGNPVWYVGSIYCASGELTPVPSYTFVGSGVFLGMLSTDPYYAKDYGSNDAKIGAMLMPRARTYKTKPPEPVNLNPKRRLGWK